MMMTGDRTPEQIAENRQVLKAFARAGYELIPLRIGTKIPRDEGWQTNSYTLAGDIAAWVKRGGNVGIRLRGVDLVLDVDPRNFPPGDNPISRLPADIRAAISAAPTVMTGRGDGGHHIYMRKPADLRIVGKLDGYEGIDVRSAGLFVVAPGSVHPDTGGIYHVSELSPPISTINNAPDALIAMIARKDNPVRIGGEGVGKLTPEQLAEFLAVLDPVDYGRGKHDRWLSLMAACHDATAGHGLPEWLAFCARDPDYASAADQDMTAYRWSSLRAGKAGGADYRTLFKAVVDAGRADLVAAFDDDDDEFPTIEIGTDDLPRYDFGDDQ